MPEDPELDAMAAINRALGVLNEDAVGRVLRWAADRYRVPLSTTRKGPVERRGASLAADGQEQEGETTSDGHAPNYADIAESNDVASPKSEADKALDPHRVVKNASAPPPAHDFLT